MTGSRAHGIADDLRGHPGQSLSPDVFVHLICLVQSPFWHTARDAFWGILNNVGIDSFIHSFIIAH